MKRQALAFAASLVCAGALAAAQSTPPPPQTPADPQQQKPAEISVTGCLVQGSAPNVFVLENARVKPEDQNEKAVTYVITVAKPEMSLKTHLNHSIKVTGTADRISAAATPPATPPAGQKPKEGDLPKFTASSVTMVSDRCEPIGQ
jgi:hypothetical protein